jgi:amino acid transporter
MLSVGILQMYNGVEIEHPVFRVLFCNLVVAFISSAVNIIVYPFEKNVRYSTIINGNNGFYYLFHCCSWLIVSILRFIYIIHKDWLFKRFPDPKVLNRLAIASVFLSFLTCWLILIIVIVLCGWPRLKIFEMPMPQKAMSAGTLLGLYILLICISCFFYLLILRKRGKLRNNKVGPDNSKIKVKSSDCKIITNQFGDVLVGDSQTNDQGQQSLNEEVY